MPKWNARKLASHYQKRMRENPGCFEDLLDISSGTLTAAQYEALSHQVVRQAWAEYQAEMRNTHVDEVEYYPLSSYFVDDNLVLAIVRQDRDEFSTCYHEHFDRPHGVDPGPGATVGQKQLRYMDKVKMDEQGKAIRNLKRIRGFRV